MNIFPLILSVTCRKHICTSLLTSNEQTKAHARIPVIPVIWLSICWDGEIELRKMGALRLPNELVANLGSHD